MWKIGIFNNYTHAGIIPEDIENEEKAIITYNYIE
jgi:hypothetical protein